MKIFKYDLVVTDTQIIRLPKDAVIQSVGIQYGCPKLWALVEENKPIIDRNIYMIGTGHSVPDYCKNFIGAFLINHNTLLFRVYE